MTPAQSILMAAAQMVDLGWCQAVPAIERRGLPDLVCARTAIARAVMDVVGRGSDASTLHAYRLLEDAAIALLMGTLDPAGYRGVCHWNDSLFMTQAEVATTMRKAAA